MRVDRTEFVEAMQRALKAEPRDLPEQIRLDDHPAGWTEIDDFIQELREYHRKTRDVNIGEY